MQASSRTERGHAGAALRLVAAIAAFVEALLTIAALFPAWDSTSSLHDTFADLFANLLSAGIMITAGVFIVAARRPAVHAAAGLLMAGTLVASLGTVLDNVFVAADTGDVRLGFWLSQVANVFLLTAGVLGAIAAAASRALQWRPNAKVEGPVPLMAVGLLVVLYMLSWALPYAVIYDQGVEIARYQAPLDRILAETWGLGLGVMAMVLAFGAVVSLRPRRIAAFLLLGLVTSDLADLVGIDRWGFDAALGGSLAPGSGTMLRFTAIVGLTAVALTMALARDDSAAVAGDATTSTVPPPVQWPVEPAPPAAPVPTAQAPAPPVAAPAAPPPPQ